jgi:Carbohydrate binding domain
MKIPGLLCLTQLLVFTVASPAAAWAGAPLFSNGDFRDGMTGWNLLCQEEAKAVAEVKEIEHGKRAVCVTVQTPGSEGYYVQLVQGNISIAGTKTYKLTFRARSKPDGHITVNLWPTTQSSDPQALWRVDQVALTDTWKEYSFDIHPNNVSGNFNLDFGGLAKQAGEYWFTDITLVEVEK